MRRVFTTLTAFLTIAAPAAAAPGAFDATFDGDGWALAPSAGVVTHADVAALAPDGDLVVAGRAGTVNTDFVVARFTAQGAPDTTFSGDGIATYDLSPGNDQASAIAFGADGRIVVAGLGQAGGSANDTAVLVLTDDGTPDPTFNGTGKKVMDAGGVLHSDYANDVLVQPDGKIVLAGQSYQADGPSDDRFLTVRLKADGSPDPTWNGTGRRLDDDFAGEQEEATALALQGDDVIVAGATAAGAGVERLTSLGAKDGAFTVFDGALVTAPGVNARRAMDVAIDGVGRIVLAAAVFSAAGQEGGLIARLGKDGGLDAGFGQGGAHIVDPTPKDDELHALALAPDGKVVVAGVANDDEMASVSEGLVFRSNPDGTPDPTFGTGGTARYPITQLTSFSGVGVLPDARIEVGGGVFSVDEPNGRLLAARLDGAVAARSLAGPPSPVAQPGAPVTLTFTAANAGPEPSQDTTVRLSLPAGATLMSLGAGQGTCTATTCAVGELGAGASTPVSAVVSFATPGDATVGATVGGTTFDPDAADDAAQAVVHVSARPDTRVPTIKLKVLKASRRTGKVRLRVSLDEPGSITLRIKQAKRRAKPGKRRTLRFTEARARIVTLKLTRAQRRAKRLIITATAVDLAGNRSTATRRVRLHR